jgi:predicted phosphodiesterase
LKKAVVFALFFEGATHLRINKIHNSLFIINPGTLKNQKVQQEFQISVLDKKRFY